MSEAPLVRLEGVAVRFDGRTEVLRGVDLEVAAGESVAIVGPSGSGKSTLLHVLGGLLRPTEGRVRLDGEDLFERSEDGRARLRNQRVGFVFQSHFLLPQCTALENVLVPALAASSDARAFEPRALELLERVGLADRVDHRPGQLSGGERQRVAVVRALLLRPAVLLADEPTGSLDVAAADGVARLLVELQEREGAALLTVTHSESLAARMERVLELSSGLLSERPPRPVA